MEKRVRDGMERDGSRRRERDLDCMERVEKKDRVMWDLDGFENTAYKLNDSSSYKFGILEISGELKSKQLLFDSKSTFISVKDGLEAF